MHILDHTCTFSRPAMGLSKLNGCLVGMGSSTLVCMKFVLGVKVTVPICATVQEPPYLRYYVEVVYYTF